MLKTTLTALAIAALSLPVTAGSSPNPSYVAGGEEGGWSLEQYRYFRDEDQPNDRTRVRGAAPAASPASTASISGHGFQFVGGDTGWQPAGHVFVMKNGRLAHSDQCDHMIRTVQGPTPAEVESTRSISPGG